MSNDASVSSISSSTHYDDSEKDDQESGVGHESSSPGQPNSEATTAPLEPPTTKVYYYIDREDDPFATTVNKPMSRVTLKDFKATLPRTNYKYFNYRLVDGEKEKTEVTDDNDVLQPNETNKIFMIILNDEQATPLAPAPLHHVPLRKQSQALQNPSYRASKMSKPSNNYFSRRRSNSLTKPRKNSFPEDTDYGDSYAQQQHYFSDDSAATTEFTSVSQQGKRRVVRHSRKQSNNKFRRGISPSFLSTSFSEASMAIDVIEVTFDLALGRLGLKISVIEESRGFCIIVAEVERDSLAARDKRIKPKMIILEVNGYRLGDYSKDQALDLLKQCVSYNNVRYVRLTFAQTERDRFTPHDDTVYPIDTSMWVKTTMVPANEECRLKMVYNPCWLNAGGFPSSGVGSSLCDSDSSYPINANMTQMYQLQPKKFNIQNKMDVAVGMVLPGGLELKHKTNGKKTFASTEMVEWLRSNVYGLEEAEKCQKFANKLVEDGLIELVIDNKQFVVKTEGYYCFTDKLKKLAFSRQKPAMDDTIHVPQKGLTARLKKFFCVGTRQPQQQQHHQQPQPQHFRPAAVRQLLPHDENLPPMLNQPPTFPQYRSSLYTQSKTHQTYIP